MALNIKSLIDKETSKLKMGLAELKNRESQLSPAQKKKMQAIEKIFGSLVSKDEHSASEKKDIRKEVKKIKNS